MIQQLKRTTVRSVATAALVVAIAVPVGWALAPAGAAPPAESSAIAAGSGPTSTTPSGADTRDAARAERRAERRSEREARLAERLGVSTDELRDARLDVLQELLDERVADGRITEERAARVMDAARSGTLRELRRELRAERAARR